MLGSVLNLRSSIFFFAFAGSPYDPQPVYGAFRLGMTEYLGP
jgi:hypothetical protein